MTIKIRLFSLLINHREFWLRVCDDYKNKWSLFFSVVNAMMSTKQNTRCSYQERRNIWHKYIEKILASLSSVYRVTMILMMTNLDTTEGKKCLWMKQKRWRYFQLPIIKSFSFSLLESDKFLGVVTWPCWTNQEKTQSRHDIQLLLTDNVIEYTKEESWSVFCCSRGPKNI